MNGTIMWITASAVATFSMWALYIKEYKRRIELEDWIKKATGNDDV